MVVLDDVFVLLECDMATPLSVSLNTLNLSKSETIDEPKSVILNELRSIWDDEDIGLIDGWWWWWW